MGSRLGRIDPEAERTEHAAVDDAHARARFGQDTVQIDLYGPDLSPTGRRVRIENYGGIATTLRLESGAVGDPAITAYWSRCAMRGFGLKTLVLRYVNEPARTVPAVHHALRCQADRR